MAGASLTAKLPGSKPAEGKSPKLTGRAGRTPGRWAAPIRIVTKLKRWQVWALTLLVTLFGGFLRWWRLGEPRAVVFDETYYVKDAYTMLMTGEARNWPDEVLVGANSAQSASIAVNDLFAFGDTDHWLPTAEYVVHPPLGKWLIALGLKLFGGAGNVVAWRAAVAIAGTVAILLLIRVLLRLFHNVSVAMLGGLLMSIDGVGIVMSRTGLLDNFIMVFALGAFSLLLMHREWAKRRLAAAFATDSRRRTARWTPSRMKRYGMLLDARGPSLAFSPYRLGAVVLLGCATGVKWSGIYFFAAFFVLSVVWDAWMRRQAGYYRWLRGGIVEALVTMAYAVPAYAATYLACWTNWFLHDDSYMHDWAQLHPGQGIQWLPEGLRSFVEYHRQMWQFHTTLDAWHAYKANPLTWPLQLRPTSFYWEKIGGHPALCSLSPDTQCVAAVTSLGNPLIWWIGSLCAIAAIVLAIIKLARHQKCWKIWAVAIGFIGGWLPWAQYLNRTTFTFYSIVILPWMILAICYVVNEIRKAADGAVYWTVWGALFGVCLLVSVFFYPIWTGMPVPYDFWLAHMWLESWI